jgi:hypothetical protein
MTKFYFLLSLSFLLSVSALYAQPTKPSAPAVCNAANCTTTIGGNPWDQCIAPNTSFVSNFSTGQLFSGTALSAGAVYRYKNVGTVGGVQINATVTVNSLFQAVLDNIDDNASADPTVTADLFAPRIRTDVGSLTTTDRRGYVQFTINFYTEAAPVLAGFHTGAGAAANNTADFTTAIALSNLNYIHYDNDGNTAGTSGTGWFRETGTVLNNTPGNINVVASGTTELKYYTYADAGNTFIGFAGSVCERNNVSSCTQVAEYYRFNVATNSLTFRLGYDYQGGPGASGTTGARQFGTRFNCVNLPSQGSLPLTLLNFNVTHRNGDAQLVWQTSDEERFSRFEVERSLDSRNFQTITDVAAKGGINTTTYNYADDIKAITSSTIFYRLKMIDHDGSFRYSAIVSLRKGFAGSKLNISPNPAGTSTTIRYKTDRSGVADIVITDFSGKTLLQRKVVLQAGENNISVSEIARFTNGVYNVKLITSSETVTDRLVVSKQ